MSADRVQLLSDGGKRTVYACPFCGGLQWARGEEAPTCDLCATVLTPAIGDVFAGLPAECDFLRCDAPAAVCFVGFDGRLYEWCRACVAQPCGRCGTPFDDDANRAKGLCQVCRDEIASWSAAGECERCGRETDETTLEGTVLCRVCQDACREQHATRDATQRGLGDWTE